MIARVTFENDLVMMFGDSYKPWTMQYNEYLCYKKLKPVKIEISKSKWIGWGGLKWCSENEFQGQLNREGCQENELDNTKPREYSKMKFKEIDIKNYYHPKFKFNIYAQINCIK